MEGGKEEAEMQTQGQAEQAQNHDEHITNVTNGMENFSTLKHYRLLNIFVEITMHYNCPTFVGFV